MNDFEDQDSDKYQFALASLQTLLYHKELPQQHVEVLTNKAIENYLSQLKEPSTATDLIVFANIYALDPSLVQSKFPELPSKVSRAISLTQKHVPRDSSRHAPVSQASRSEVTAPMAAEEPPTEIMGEGAIRLAQLKREFPNICFDNYVFPRT